MPARLIMPDHTCPVVLEDLSEDGASITLPESCAFVVCVLRWMDMHAFADVVWRDGLAVGLRFDRPIPADVLTTTELYVRQNWARLRHGDASLRRC